MPFFNLICVLLCPMKLIADSGSTKTDWVLTDGAAVRGCFQTQGLNPFHQSEDDIMAILRQELLPQLPNLPSFDVFFYGSGVRPELEPLMQRALRAVLSGASAIEVHGDLLGAARAVCGADEGIACILGTGSNSCLYDGRQVVANIPPLGYILGDEGSGAVLGVRFLNALYKGFMPDALVTEFQNDIKMSMADVIARVYRQPMANRFLASLSPFIRRHTELPQVHQLVVDNFRDFFRRNVLRYQRPDLPVGFVGSIACSYDDCLHEAAMAEGLTLGRIMKTPIDGLVAYHQY